MREFTPEAVPEGLPDDVSDWLLRQFYNLRYSLETVTDIDGSIPFTGYVKEGMLRFFPNGPTGVEPKGFYGYHTGVWNFIA